MQNEHKQKANEGNFNKFNEVFSRITPTLFDKFVFVFFLMTFLFFMKFLLSQRQRFRPMTRERKKERKIENENTVHEVQ